jgi:quercetin dioxygenase-like cupin family protein
MHPIDTVTLERLHISSDEDQSLRWAGAFVTHGGKGATQSTSIVFEIEPGCRLGWHTDQTEETQYIIAGSGQLETDEGNFPVGPGAVFVLPVNVGHDLVNTGSETMRAVAFFAAAMFTQVFDNVLLPPNSHVIGTPNRDGEGAPPPRTSPQELGS